MSENVPAEKNNLVEQVDNTKFKVMLPCEPENFSEFISGLLGKPQTIEKSISSIFEIEREDVINTFHLVNQRICQQNEASLIQFNVKILYDDNSSVLLNSLIDFMHYTEIRPIASVGVILSWTYLIKFKDKQVPEKQVINLSFRGSNNDFNTRLTEDDFVHIRANRWFGSSGIFLRIEHTERTWGVDIESLLTGHIKTLCKTPSKTKIFISKNYELIGLITAALFFLSAILAVYFTSSNFVETYLAKVQAISDMVGAHDAIIASKINFLIEVISTGVWPRFIFAVIVFLVISFFLSIFLGFWVISKSNQIHESHVLLSKAAYARQTKSIKKHNRDWFMFMISIGMSFITSVAANMIFIRYFSEN